MKKIYYILILLIILPSCKDESEEKKQRPVTEAINVEELEQEGFNIFQEQPEKAVSIFKIVSKEYRDIENYKKAGLTNLNIANIYDEYMNEIDSSIHFANKSLTIWNKIKDTLQQANLYKYIGLLKGKQGSYTSAEQDIQKAIMLYELMEFDQGIAVSKFNLSQVYYQAGKKEESIKLFENSVEFWRMEENMDRVFTNNLFGIELYESIGDHDKVSALLKENNGLLGTITLNKYLKNRYEELLKKHEK